jgi:hypothetical protein
VSIKLIGGLKLLAVIMNRTVPPPSPQSLIGFWVRTYTSDMVLGLWSDDNNLTTRLPMLNWRCMPCDEQQYNCCVLTFDIVRFSFIVLYWYSKVRMGVDEQERLSNIILRHKLCYSIFSFICMFCRSLFVLLYFFFWPLCCLFFFDIRILITPLVTSNSS